ncbi:helix-turn-helix transcriptional regulator [Cupriavidus basilensis]|uniref:Helix-turn-helix transcriptional regulator n=1 Tax=Cupriavidus basilensis TaxID=68895 RepID=A0ABT6AX11_9BURK|nr:helix-turn-helix transcriptional regulator [Cupriavidus basilensis]MDF3837173.1 helix-turn-helix transcriptional regulator [Cupriavidus basilensis]
MTQAITPLDQLTTGMFVIKTSQTEHDRYQAVVPPVPRAIYLTPASPTRHISAINYNIRLSEWKDIEYRQAYLEESIEQGVAWQIKTNRQQRGLSQRDLADVIGTHQSAISRLEDPMSGLPNLETLVKVAHAFDCALSVRLISYAQLSVESDDLSPDALFAAPFDPHTHLLGNRK